MLTGSCATRRSDIVPTRCWLWGHQQVDQDELVDELVVFDEISSCSSLLQRRTPFFRNGFHTDDAYSRCGLTSDVYSFLQHSGIQCLNALLIWPKTALLCLQKTMLSLTSSSSRWLVCPQTLSSLRSASLHRLPNIALLNKSECK